MKRVLVVYGTRPEAIKLAPLVHVANAASDVECIVAVTGQHREMLDQVNKLFGVEPHFDLDVFEPGQSLNTLISKMVSGLDDVMQRCHPDVVVVQGDTSSAVAGALAAFYRNIPVVHAEAGLRSYNLHSPFPEEANRRIVSQVASLHLVPTLLNKMNLLNENIKDGIIFVTGNTVIDALLTAVKKPVQFSSSELQAVVDSASKIVTVTTHRRENQGNKMRDIALALSRLAEAQPDVQFVLPLHLNPTVRAALLPRLKVFPNVTITDPLDYAEFTKLLDASSLILTDSGGVQEEAPSLGKPVLVMRSDTERPEGIVAGTVKLVGADPNVIFEETMLLLNDESAYSSMSTSINPYGDGHAAERTLTAIRWLLGEAATPDEFSSWTPDEAELIRASQMVARPQH